MTRQETCIGCRAFESGTAAGDGDGECRRHPPKARFFERGRKIGAAWPVVQASDWCLDFSAYAPSPKDVP
ncbi:MAG TPA: hypothetical protein VLL76_11155 [Candidatus Omnitrophota bacterium]|nr:hypothetical protein [Candidatus Omnitrophota bacterium]